MSQLHPLSTSFPRQPSEQIEPHSLGHNLPTSPTSLIGRKQELVTVAEMLRQPDVRLLTLIGPPGIGKTRLGMQVASNLLDDFSDGVYFVPLAPISDPDLVIPSIAQAVGIKEVSGQPLLQSLQEYLRDKSSLLLVDNFEQVPSAAPLLADLLSTCLALKVVVTSRELLHLYGEYDYPVPSLPSPSVDDSNRLRDLEAFSQYEAIKLFLQRAQAVSPDFRLSDHNAYAIADICQRLDGLPLAIELAAARILVLSPEELLARLKSSLKVLTGGALNLPERQRTLQAAIDWSYNLLSSDEQALFRRLGVFAGGCTLNAIERVCSSGPELDTLDGVTSLVGKSLLQRQESVAGAMVDEPRFVMLETIRAYATWKLEESGELDSIRDRHFHYFLQLAEDAANEALGNDQALWMRRLDDEQNNLRAALEWSLTQDGRTGLGLRLVGALARYWDNRGYFSEGRRWCIQILTRIEATEPSVERAKVLEALARMAWQQGDFAEARSNYEKSLEMHRALGNDSGVAAVLLGLGSVTMWQGEYAFSHAVYQESLAIARRLGNRHLISRALSMIGVILMRKQEYRAALSPLEEALAIERELGNGVGIADTLFKQGSVAFHLGEYEQSKRLIEESLRIGRELRVEYVLAICLARLGMIALRQGDPQNAEMFLLEGLTRARDSGIRRWSRWYLVGLAEVARLRGLVIHAARLIGASEGALSSLDSHYEPATHDEINRIIASVRAEFDEETFTRLCAEGRTMSLDEAIAFSAGSLPDISSEPEQPHVPAGTASLSQGSTTLEGRETPYPDNLTEREVEVLRLIAVGKSNEEIARELILSLRTVERHISNIYQKIGATGKVARAAATAYALHHGLAA